MSTLKVHSPYDRSLVGQIEQADGAAVDHALAIAHELHRNRDGWLSLMARIEVLERAAQLMSDQHQSLALQSFP